MCDFKSLVDPCGVYNPAGTKTDMWLAAADDVTNIPKFKSDMIPAGTDPGDSVTIGEVYTMAATKYFKKFKIIAQSGKVEDNLVGEIGGKTFESMFTFQLAGTKADQLEFAKCVANGCLIAIPKEKSGQLRNLGSKDDYAWIESIALTTGQKSGDLRGGTYVIKSVQGHPAPVYDSALVIPVAP